MNRKMFFKLAGNNIRKNKNVYFPFILMGITMVCVFYMMYAILKQIDTSTFRGGSVMTIVLDLGVKITGILSLLIVFYTNSFLMKKRTAEIGLYNILGLEKKHIRKMLVYEFIVVVVICIAGGLVSGIVLSKLVYMFLLKLIDVKVGLSFSISAEAVLMTAAIFIVIYFMTLLYNCAKISIARPVEMLRNANEGEREPKSKWILGLLGLISLGIGYYLAVNTSNAVQAMNQFFFAVLFVIVGTYLLFIAGSIIFLKILKKNKKFYYSKNHFATVSGMIYRMKQNAAGLSSICLLSTGVILTLSTTFSLYIGIDDIIDKRYPFNVIQEYSIPEKSEKVDLATLDEVTNKAAEDYNVKLSGLTAFYALDVYGSLSSNGTASTEYTTMKDYTVMSFVIYEDYVRLCEDSIFKNIELKDNEILVSSTVDSICSLDNMDINDTSYQIVANQFDEKCTAIVEDDYFENFNYCLVIVKDLQTLKQVCKNFELSSKSLYFTYEYNVDGKEENIYDFCDSIEDRLKSADVKGITSCKDRYQAYDEAYGIYGGLIFVGIFVGFIFLLTTVLIIYYKQISEGISDRERFIIMRKVGMNDQEVKKIIRNQIVMVFFIPVVAAIVHIGFSFDMMKKILALFNLDNTSLFVEVTLITIIIFTLIYTLVYMITARTYFKLTNRKY